MSERPPPSTARRARTAAVIALLLVLGLVLTLVSTAPAVETQPRPTAADVAAAHNVIHQVKTSQQQGVPAHVTLDSQQLGAIAILAGEASGVHRVDAKVRADTLSARASLHLIGDLWINARATVAGTSDGFPPIQLRVGRLPLPTVVSRWSANLIHWLLVRDGAELPALDELVRYFAVINDTVTAELALPPSTGLTERLVSVAGASVDEDLVSRIYCRLASSQAEGAAPQLVSLIHEAFRELNPSEAVTSNRAALVAVALYVVGEQAYPLAPSVVERARGCHPRSDNIVLRERADLAKHWAFSAALTAVLGEQTAANLGEWKELHDSLPSGSGFSFVDLAADRSGLHVARRAMDPPTASLTARSLGTVSEDSLLPEALLQASEGLDDLAFAEAFGGLDEKRYRDAVRRIDQHLSHWQRPAGQPN